MANKAAVFQYFPGGIATDAKYGVKGSAAGIQAFDVRASPSKMSVLPAATLEGGAAINDLILGEVMTLDGTIYATGDAGYVYRRTTSGSWSVIGQLNSGCGGIDYRVDTDSIYITSNKTVSQISTVSTAPVFQPDFYGTSISKYIDPSGTVPPTDQEGSGKTTVLGTEIDESDNNRRLFKTDIEPAQSISVFGVAKGTGNWKLTLHDGTNNVLGAATINNASLKVADWNNFVFSATASPTKIAGTAANVAGVGTADWTNPGNITAKDGSYATFDTAGPTDSHYLQATNFGLSVPTNATIVGIEAQYWRHQDGPTASIIVVDNVVKIVKGGSITGTNLAGQANWSGNLVNGTGTYGGTTELWGTTWAPADVNASTFGVALAVTTGGTSGIASVDSVSMTVYYTLSSSTGQVRLYPAPNARTYHFHLTSSVGTGNGVGTVSSTSVNDMGAADMQLYADRLVYPRSGLHPMERFLQYELIGNGNYVSAWEPISSPPTNDEWVRAQLTVPMEYECCGVAHTNEFFIAAFEKVSTNIGSSPQEGLIIFWDGTSATYNYDVPITEGAPYGLHVYQNVAYYYAAGSLWAMTSPTTQPIKLRNMPGFTTEFSGTNSPIKVYPSSMTVRRGVQVFGFPGVTTNMGVNFGVWSWGATDKNYPQALSYNYVLSTGSQTYSASNNLRIGMVKSFDDLMHISWRDDLNGGYGIDKVDNTVPPAPTAIYQTLVVDNGYAGKYKGGLYVEAYYNLLDGATIQFAYQFNRNGTWVTDAQSYSATSLWQGHTGYARFGITADSTGAPAGTFREVQGQITITTPGTATTPSQVYMVAIIFDDKRDEQIG